MQRRGGSGQPAKGQSANRPKARNAPTAPASPADLQEQVAALTRELKEARDHQTATGEIQMYRVYRRRGDPCSKQ